jgi:hypothetical protein
MVPKRCRWSVPVDATRITVTKRDRKVSLRLSGMPSAAAEGVCVTSEEAQCAANAITRLPKENRRVSLRFGALAIVHFPGHHQPVELRFSDPDWSVVVDLSRNESYTVSDMLRGAGISDRPFDGEMTLQYVPRVTDHRRVALPDAITSLLAGGTSLLGDDDSADPTAPRPRLPAPREPGRMSTRQDRPPA